MKFLIVLALVGACVAAEDQKADDALVYSSFAGYPHGYSYGAHPYSAFGYSSLGYHAPSVYSAYSTYPYTYGAHSYVHHLKKRDTAAAEDQKADDALIYSAYAGYPHDYAAFPRAYSGAYYRTAHYAAPTAYSTYAAHPLTYGRYFY